jgi:LPPG:FO 2-phospho-L-lactate transferase
MCDQPVRTKIKTDGGELAFQHYFVRDQCAPAVKGFYFEGVEQATTHPAFLGALQDPELSAIIICPSNPFVSVDPILALSGVRAAMQASAAPVIAVSPIVGGMAIKGPAAKMMAELNMPASAQSVAEYYGDLLDGFIVDITDVDQCDRIRQRTLVTDTIMTNMNKKKSLAQACLGFAASL